MAYQAGTAFITVSPSFRGFQTKADAEVKKLRAVEIPATLNLDTAKARTELDAVTRPQTVALNVNADAGKARTELDALSRNRTATVDVRTTGVDTATRGFGTLTTAIVGLAPVAVPALAAVAAGVGVVGSALITAGAGAGVFGAAVAGQVHDMVKSQKAIDATAKSLSALTPGTKEYTAKLKELHDQQAAFNKQFGPAAKGLDNLKGAWQGFLGATRVTSVGVIGKGLNLVAGILPRLVPLANAVGGAVGGLLDDFKQFTQTKRFEGILRFFTRTAPSAVTSFGHILGNVLLGVFNLFRAFAPQQKAFLGALEGATKRFSVWSAGFGKSNGFQKFMDYVRRTLPDVKTLFSNLIEFIGKFVVALGPLGGVEIKVLTSLLQWLNKLPVSVLTAFAVGITAIVLGVKAVVLGLKAWAAIQAVVNVLLDANPLGIVVVAIAALAVAMVVAYKKSKTFRDIVNTVWADVKTGAQAMWKIIHPILNAWVWTLQHYLFPVLKFLWERVVKPYYTFIGHLIAWTWKNVIQPALKAFWAFISNVLIPVVRFLWVNVVKPYFKAVGTWIQFVWTGFIHPILKTWWNYLKFVLFPVIRFLWENVVKPTFTSIGGHIKDVWNHVVHPVFDDFVRGLGVLKQAFRNAVDAIGKIWDGLKSAVSGPVRFVVNTVYNNGIRKVVNAIPGVSDLPALKVNFAEGGVMPGYTPGRDVHHFVSPTGGHLALSGGEAIMRPEFTRAVGGERGVAALNERARLLRGRGIHHFAGGGIFRPTAGGSYGAIHDQWTGFPAVDLRVGTGTPVHAAASGRVTVSEDLATSYGHWIKLAHQGFQSLYAHLERRLVGRGASVAGGQLIGYSDSTGNSTGPHLHFGVAGRSPLEFMHASTNYGAAGAHGSLSGGSSGGFHIPNPLRFLHLDQWKNSLGKMGDWGHMLGQMVGNVGGQFTGWVKDKMSHLLGAVGSTAATGLGLNGGTVQQIVQGLASRSGWGSGAEWAALASIISSESGWNPRAQNPTSTAYGLFQFLDSTWGSVGGHKTSSPGLQTQYGLRYIANRYHDPIGAWNFHKSHGWYDDGGYIPPGVSTVFNGTGKPEPVLTSAQWADIRKAGMAGGQATSDRALVHNENVYVTDVDALVRKQRADQHKALTMARLA